MKLFEMFATLSLDTSAFETGATEAITKSGDIEDAIEKINTDSIDADIASLDKEIAELDAEIAALDFDNATLEKEMEAADTKAAATQGVLQGLWDVGKELAVEAVKCVTEFASESLDAIAESGTAAGNQLKQARTDWELTSQSLKLKTGAVLAPIASSFYDLAESIAGVTDADRVNVLLSNMESYSFENLQGVQKSLEGIFGAFEKWDPKQIEESVSFSDMTGGLESQIAYWEEYDKVLKDLQSRGVSSDILAKYADGSQSSLQQLQAMGTASDEELASLNATYAALEEARTNAAKTISNAQLEVDETISDMNESIMRLGIDIAADQGASNVYNAAQGIINTLSASYPEISAQVDAINTKLSKLGQRWEREAIFLGEGVERERGGGVGESFAIGLDYVPKNDFPALLHEGEAVLTKAEATAWRRGETRGGSVELAGLHDDIVSAVREGMAGMTVSMDTRTVGQMVAPTVSKEIAREIRRPGR